ncbi:glycosyltransferase family 2 protein [Lutibacter sp.]|uniref:glycosyltransferase family 2 protein n=1 Tax=Lutibacter sp. TaxID=1925666 RepID=UPI00356945A1
MKFSLIICTYQRPVAIIKLLDTIQQQTLYPNEIIVVDGSLDDKTQNALTLKNYENVSYFKASEMDRGLTKQRNFGISKVNSSIDIICFLDDDTIPEPSYFEALIATYQLKPKALGVGGYITNEVKWQTSPIQNGFSLDGFYRKESTRFKIRRFLGLIDDTSPGFMPKYSHGRPVSYLPPSNKIYPVELFMGGISSFRKEVFNTLQFSTYFEGYGLYEDADFCLRLSTLGELYVNTSARIEHYHEASGRPNKYTYGKMVVRNGWYVWRVKYPKPLLKAKLLFHCNVIVLLKLRFINAITGRNKKEAFTEALGRLVGWFSLFFNKPILK